MDLLLQSRLGNNKERSWFSQGLAVIRRGLKYLIQSRVWVALGASSVNAGTALLLGERPALRMMTIQFLVCYAIYSLNLVSDLKEDAVGNPKRAAFARRFQWGIILVSVGSVGVAVGLAWGYGVHVLVGTVIPFLIGLGYGFACIPTHGWPWRVTRLKDIPLVKNLTVAGTWALTAVLLQERGEKVWSSAAVACVVLIGLRVLVTSILPDWRDRHADGLHGVKTIPVVWGEAVTLRLVQGLNWLFAVGVLACVGTGVLKPSALGLLFFFVYGAGYLWVITRQQRVTSFMSDVVVDGEHVLFGGVLFVASWIVR